MEEGERAEGESQRDLDNSSTPISTGAASFELFYKLEFHVGLVLKGILLLLKNHLA